MLPPKAMDYLIKTTVPSMRNIFSSFWSGKPKRIPKLSMWTTAIALNSLPEFECKTLLLKTPHTLDTDLERLEPK